MTNLSKTIFSSIIIMAVITFSLSAQQYFDNWKITPAAEGNSVTMVIANPATPLKVEAEMDYQVDNAGVPVKASVKFKDGIERTMNADEMGFYWSLLKGANAYWNFLQPQGKISTFTSTADMIPLSYLGRMVRVVSNEGNIYMGTLSQNTNTPEWFSLDIKGNRVLFWRKAVREIQTIK
jgi:hypothetical protein